MPEKMLRLRRRDTCVRCGAALEAGVVASWDRDRRSVTCLACVDGVAVSVSDPPAAGSHPAGPSLGREYERRRAGRERRTREAHPYIGGLLLALSDEPQHQKAFRQGQQGEIAVGEAIQKAVDRVGGVVLHNRRPPGGRGDIDHIVIVPSGVYVVDSKAVTGKVEVHNRWFKPPLLFIGGRDRSDYLDGLDRQVQTVRQALGVDGGETVSVRGVLCFTKADLPFLRTVEMREHLLLYRKALVKRLIADGPLTPERHIGLAAGLDEVLRPA